MEREDLRREITDTIASIDLQHPTRVAVDGFTASGKTSLANELVPPLEDMGREVVRASLDDFKRPWSERHLYDRESGEGYYRNAYDYHLVRKTLLEPLSPGGDRRYRTGHIDPASQCTIENATGVASDSAILIVDAVFLFRPEINDLWDFRIFVDIGSDLVLERGLRRDRAQEGSLKTLEDVYRNRYIASEKLYVSAVEPMRIADVIVDNRDFIRPSLRWNSCHFQ